MNAIDDAQDIASGTSEDCDSNGVPDECDTEPTFVPGVITSQLSVPTDVAVADLDGDDKPDVLIASLLDDKISWSRNGACSYYLVRTENPCGSDMGASASGVPHTGPACN